MRVWLLPRAYAINKVLVVVRVPALTFDDHAVRPISFFRIVPKARLRLARYHIGGTHQAFDCSVRAKNSIADTKPAVAEYRLPGNHDVAGKIESDRDRVRDFPSILLREYASRHVSRGWQRQVESS